MKVIVFGASGRTGKACVELALGAKHEVTAFVRNPAALELKNPSLKVIQGDGHDLAAVEAAMAGQDAAIVAVGEAHRGPTTLRQDVLRGVISGMKKHGGKRIVFLSAAGVGDSLPQMPLVWRFFIRVLLKNPYADADAAEQLIRSSGLQWVLARPVGLNDKPPTRHVTAITDGSNDELTSYIPRADVARFMVIQLTEDRYLGSAVTLCS